MTATHTPLTVPDHMSRADIGAYMRELRLHYGLTEADVSERLHIRVRYVTAIEQANFEAMPGRAYARGYVHTYAEFLGLDADQVIERCFGPELAREAQAHTVPQSSLRARSRQRWGAVLVVVLLGVIGYFLFFSEPVPTSSNEIAVSSTVDSVPEDMLIRTRTHAMATPETHDCLGRETHLGCFYAQRLTQLWIVPAPLADMAPAAGEAASELVVEEEAPVKKEPAKQPATKPAPAKVAAKPSTVKPGELKRVPAKAEPEKPAPAAEAPPQPQPEEAPKAAPKPKATDE